MKEVRLKHFVGPFEEVPYDNFIQSPIGLVPKSEPGETRLIFHLSHPRTYPKEPVYCEVQEFRSSYETML